MIARPPYIRRRVVVLASIPATWLALTIGGVFVSRRVDGPSPLLPTIAACAAVAAMGLALVTAVVMAVRTFASDARDDIVGWLTGEGADAVSERRRSAR